VIVIVCRILQPKIRSGARSTYSLSGTLRPIFPISYEKFLIGNNEVDFFPASGYIPVREQKMTTTMDIAAAVKAARRSLKLRQADLAAAAGVGVRFLIELEAGKPTAQLGKTLAVLNALGLDCHLVARSTAGGTTS
jgi:HTH-type transcriptional regulator/antitoxin HipB